MAPLPKEYYTRFLSDIAKMRRPNPIWSLMPMEMRPGMLSLLAGQPNATSFPLTSVRFTARSPSWDPADEQEITIDHESLETALQYSNTSGLPQMLNWIWGLQEFSHGRKKGEGWRPTMGTGSQDAIYKAVSALVNPGDSVLLDSPVYAGVLPIFHSLNCEMIEIETDSDGIKSSSLRIILETWPMGKPKPKILYTVPYGCNPTGMTASLERRLEILHLAREYDFLILEDDPYFYLYYGKNPRPPSYFALELQLPEVGRVIRFDSFSKTLSSGMRIGFASGPEPILDIMDRHTAVANIQVSSISQVIAYTILNSWGYEGFKSYTEKVSEFYRQKRDVFDRAMKKNLDGLVQWDTPEAGMFFWFKLILGEEGEDECDSEDIIRTKALEKGVLALPGTIFMPNGGKSAYCRASFSMLTEKEVDEALRRLRMVLLKEKSGA